MSIAIDPSVEAEVVELDDKGSADLFDRIAQSRMGVSGTEFLARWDAGVYEGVNYDDVPGLVEVVIALPFAR